MNRHGRELVLWLVDWMHRYLPLLVTRTEMRSKRIIQCCLEEGLFQLWLVLAHGTTFDFPVFLSHGPVPFDMGNGMARVTTMTITATLRIAVWMMRKRWRWGM